MNTTKKIMIVDDDEDDIEFFCEAVEEIDASYTCITAKNGEDALQQLAAAPGVLPDCIFLDLNMPRMDGKTCLQKIKGNSHLSTIPIVIYTTSSHVGEKEELLKLGAAHFVTKAVTFEHLKKSIEETLHMV